MIPVPVAVRIVIPCKSADSTIEPCLQAISRTRGIDTHTVVVDDGNNSRLRYLQKKYGFALVTSGGGRGAGAARNLGAMGFAGDVLVFVDADVELTFPDTIAKLVEPIVRGEAEATVGCYSASCRNNFFSSYKHLYLAYTYGTRTGKLKNTFWTGLCAVNRAWFEDLGAFKECYAGAGPEDIEFGITLTGKGGRIVAVPEARGTHLTQMGCRGIVSNDLRKGSEDVYVHWSRKIPLTNNRHVETADIFAVAFASCLASCAILYPLIGILPSTACAGAYLVFRKKLLVNAFWGRGIGFFLQSAALGFILDLVRACAIVAGTVFWILDSASGGKWRPFIRRSDASMS